MIQAQFQIRDGMRMAFDVAIEMDDGVVMRADVYLPIQEGRYPIVLTYGPYAKGLSFQEGNPGAWSHLTKNNPSKRRCIKLMSVRQISHDVNHC